MPMDDDLAQTSLTPPKVHVTTDSHEQHNNGKRVNLEIHDTNKGKMSMYCLEEASAKFGEGWSITKDFQLGGKSNKNEATQRSILPPEKVVVAASAALKSGSKR